MVLSGRGHWQENHGLRSAPGKKLTLYQKKKKEKKIPTTLQKDWGDTPGGRDIA
jgi:hypothetical protein